VSAVISGSSLDPDVQNSYRLKDKLKAGLVKPVEATAT